MIRTNNHFDAFDHVEFFKNSFLQYENKCLNIDFEKVKDFDGSTLQICGQSPKSFWLNFSNKLHKLLLEFEYLLSVFLVIKSTNTT